MGGNHFIFFGNVSFTIPLVHPISFRDLSDLGFEQQSVLVTVHFYSVQRILSFTTLNFKCLCLKLCPIILILILTFSKKKNIIFITLR